MTELINMDNLPYKVKFVNDTEVELSKICSISNQLYSIKVEKNRFVGFISCFEDVEDIFPNNTPSEREFLDTGITPEELSAGLLMIE